MRDTAALIPDGIAHLPDRSKSSPPAWVPLRSSALSVEINPLGAQLSTLRDADGRDLLWDGDPAVWNGRAPLLFPIVGTLAGGEYRVGNKTYRLPRHGLARVRLFSILRADDRAATFRLVSDAASFEVYPFEFELDVTFELHEASLTVMSCIRNTGRADLLASFGYHPAFRWPLPYGRARAAHYVEFALPEPAPIRRLDGNGLLASDARPTPVVGRRLALVDELFQEDALIMDQVRSRSVTYGAPDGPRLQVEFPDAPYLGLWSKPGAGFVCVEPWHGLSDPAGFAGDFRDKPGVFTVPPGTARPVKMVITWTG
jgi:galactose mutarotase-like enzyme